MKIRGGSRLEQFWIGYTVKVEQAVSLFSRRASLTAARQTNSLCLTLNP